MSDYKTLEGTNQSSLKKILTHPQLFLQAKKKQDTSEQDEAAHFTFGRAVDIMLVGNKEEFDENFVKIPDETKCSDAIKIIIDDLFLKLDGEELTVLEDYPSSILLIARENKYRDNYKDDTLIATVIKEGNAYFELLKTTIGKTPITETEYSKAVNCTMAVKSNEFTQKYCRKQPGLEFWDRFIVQFDLRGTQMKGEIDRVVINHNTKTITPVDFKTTGLPIYTFNSEFWKLRYDIQAGTYTIGLKSHPDIINLVNKGYKIETFKYIVVEKDLINFPMVFNVTPEVLFVALEGGERKPWKIEGLFQAIDRLQFAQINNKWNFPKEYYEKGEIDIKL